MAMKRRTKRRGHRKRRVTHAVGAAPGTLSAHPDALPSQVHVIGYGAESLVEQDVTSVEQLQQFVRQWPVVWVNVIGLGDARFVAQIGELLGLHRLALEDVLHVLQRPKVEDYGDNTFIVLRLLHQQERLISEQISLFLGSNFVVTFQERPGDCFEPVRDRLRRGLRRMREGRADYLAYALLDAVVDSYFPVAEDRGDELEQLEEVVSQHAAEDAIGRIYRIRQDLLLLRRTIWPLREAVAALRREDNLLIEDGTRIYLRDAYDHVGRLMDMVESYRETSRSLMDVYLATLSNRAAEVTKLLTIIATIFIPLTFIAGVYGMNFSRQVSPWNMPELYWYWGYPFALSVMALVALTMLVYFRRKGWIGGRRKRSPPLAPELRPDGDNEHQRTP